LRNEKTSNDIGSHPGEGRGVGATLATFSTFPRRRD